jgi:Methane oxygenase PmoA
MRILFFFLALPFTAIAQKITIDAVNHHRVKSPVPVNITKPGLGFFGLYDKSNGKTYPLQWENNDRAWFILEDSLAAGKQKQLELKSAKNPSNSVTLSGYEDGIMVKNNGKAVLFYHTNESDPPADSPAYYKRSGFIHPLYSPAGKALTDDFPVTHAHQHALFHSWPETRFRNSHVDFWNQFKQEGTVRHLVVRNRKEGAVFSELTTVQEYISFKHGVVLRETWTIRVFATPMDHFLYDIFIEQENVTTDSLFLDKYIYGGMAFRGSKHWDPQNKKAFQNPWHVLTAENLQDSSANHTSAKWVTASGLIDGIPGSVTVFDHNTNFRYPQKIRVHPTMPYWAYSPVVDGPFIIPPGGKYKAQYRYYVSDITPPKYLLERIHENWLTN